MYKHLLPESLCSCALLLLLHWHIDDNSRGFHIVNADYVQAHAKLFINMILISHIMR